MTALSVGPPNAPLAWGEENKNEVFICLGAGRTGNRDRDLVPDEPSLEFAHDREEDKRYKEYAEFKTSSMALARSYVPRDCAPQPLQLIRLSHTNTAPGRVQVQQGSAAIEGRPQFGRMPLGVPL
jgi:hypothetical protein